MFTCCKSFRYFHATKLLNIKNIRRFQHVANKNTLVAASPSTLSNEVEQCFNRLDLKFENSKEAFKSKTNYDLIRGLLVFRLCTFDYLVQHNQQILHFLRKLMGPTLFRYILKSTFYGHFVAGETQTEDNNKDNKENEEEKKDQKPKGIFAKVKYYFKKYWYIAVPVHMTNCVLWFTTIYLIVRRYLFFYLQIILSGVNVIAVLEFLNMPDFLIEKIKNTPKSAGYLVMATILYKIFTPVRYLMTLGGIQIAFKTLKKLGLLRAEGESVKAGARRVIKHYQKRKQELKKRI